MSLFEYVLNHCLRKLKLRNFLLSTKLKLYYRWIKSPSLVTPTPFETTLHFRNLFIKQPLYYHSICVLVASLELSLSKFCMLRMFPISSPLQLIILTTFISNYEEAFYKSMVFANPTLLPIPLIQISPRLCRHTSYTYIRVHKPWPPGRRGA